MKYTSQRSECRREYASWQPSGERRLGLNEDVQAYRRSTEPDYLYPAYVSGLTRAPTQPLIKIPHTLSEVTGPQFKTEDVSPNAADLTWQHSGEPLRERIIVTGQVTDDDGRREMLMARSITGSPGSLGWNVILEGREGTVFFRLLNCAKQCHFST